MSETAGDDEALEGRSRAGLGAAVVVAVLCLLGIVAIRRMQAFLNSVGRRHMDEP
jgi:hypothetical protein